MNHIKIEHYGVRRESEELFSKSHVVGGCRVWLFIAIITAAIFLCEESSAVGFSEKHLLFINSYGYDFETVPSVVNRVRERLKGKASIQYLFMNEKYISDKDASEILSRQLEIMLKKYDFQAVILGDDAAFDFAVRERGRFFKGVPLIYENINNVAKAEQYEKDPLITGIVEAFPIRETIETALLIQKHARRVVVISDNSVSGVGSAEQALAQKKYFPDLDFEIFDCSTMTKDEIKKNIASYSSDAILLYTVFNVDKDGERYTIAQGVKLITDAASVPVFKADEAGMGDGLLGGYQLSYESIGDATADIAVAALENRAVFKQPYRTGKCIYQFDRQVMDRFKILKSRLPNGSIFLNDPPDFYDKYKYAMLFGLIAALFVAAVVILRRRALMQKIEERDRMLHAEERANRAKTDFLSRMSHDIRTPLNGIIGMAYLADKEKNPPNTEDALRKIDVSSKFLLGLINDILDMAKVESEDIELHREPFPLESFMEYLNSVILPLCSEKNIKFVTDIRQVPGYMPMLDILRVNQIFFNLFSNAVKFTSEGGVITYRLREQLADDGKHLEVDCEVSDNGIGMSEDFQKVLFDPFTQENRIDNSKSRGSGLGLAIVKKTVDLMGGSISVQSKTGSGTTFKLHFICDCQPCQHGKKQIDAMSQTDGRSDSLQGQHVLLCEDHPLNQEIARRLLEGKGMIVSTADDGKAGLEMFRNSTNGFFKAVIMDIRMPVMDGYAATAAIRALDRKDAKSVPIIAMTADAFDDDMKKCLHSGMDAFIAKPVNPEKLFSILTKFIDAS